MPQLLYKTLIVEFGEEGVLYVFDDDKISLDGKDLLKVEFFKAIVKQPKQKIPLEYLILLFSRVELFLIKKQYPLNKFLDKLVYENSQRTAFTPANEILNLFEPYLDEAYSSTDLYKFCLKLLQTLHEIQVNGSSFSLINHKLTESLGVGTMQLLYDQSDPERYAYDVASWKTFIIKGVTLLFGLPPYDSVIVKSDCRKLENILFETSYEFKDKTLLVDGIEVGKKMSHKEFILANPQYKNCFSPEGWSGVWIEKDYYSEKQCKMLLRSGCFYGAPANLFDITYTPQKQKTYRILKNMINAISEKEAPQKREEIDFLAAHNMLLSKFEESLKVEYNSDQRKISINGTYITRDFPAQLLNFLCVNYRKSKTTEYKYQDIISSSSFNFDVTKPNLNVRIQRLQKSLETLFPAIELQQTGRGEFSFTCSAPITILDS